MSNQSTFTQLANAPTALPQTFLNVYDSSAVINWAAMPLSPSSLTAEGYELDASTTNFGALFPGGQVFSSITYNTSQSTLTIASLDFSNTYYFRVGSLNYASVPNYTTLSRLNLQITVSTTGVSFGGLDPTVFDSTISISSIVVTNVGNIPVTLSIYGATATVGSPWTLGVSSDVETPLFQGAWNSVQPPSSVFSTPITVSTVASGGVAGNYAGNDQNGAVIPPGATRSLWFQFWRPTSTITNTKQNLQVFVKSYYP
jgi:hypothetical protein